MALLLICHETLAEAKPLLHEEVETRGGRLPAKHQKSLAPMQHSELTAKPSLPRADALIRKAVANADCSEYVCLVRVSWFLLHVSWFLVPVAWFLVLENQCEHIDKICSQA